MKKFLYLACCLFFVAPMNNLSAHCGICGVGDEKAEEHMHMISAEDLKAKFESNADMVVINVLSEKTYEDCHIEGSINIPLGALEVATKEWPKDKKIIVYCANYACSASKKAHEKLTQLGFTHVYAYEGGTKEWRDKGFPTKGACQAGYLTRTAGFFSNIWYKIKSLFV